METAKKTLLANRDLRSEFGFGRDLSTRLARLLPHVRMGQAGRGEKLLVRRDDVETLIDRATKENADLWQLTRDHTPDTFRAWLSALPEGLN